MVVEQCLRCEYANILNNKCEINNTNLFLKGEQIAKKCNKFVKANGNYNEERSDNQ